MSSADAPVVENQLVSASMKTSEAAKLEPSDLDPLPAADGFGGYLPTVFVVAAFAAVVFGVLASNSGEPLLLTLMAVLAMLGLFLLFGIAAGHVRIGARTPAADLLKAAADSAIEPALIVGPQGALYWNPAFEKAFGQSTSGPFSAIEAAVRSDAASTQALFRLTRAAERGEPRREDLRIGSSARSQIERVMRIAVRPVLSAEAPSQSGKAQSAVYWQFTDITADAAAEAQRIGDLQSSLAVFDDMPTGLISVVDGAILHINATFEAWLGYSRGALKARSMQLSDLAGEDGARLLTSIAANVNAEQRSVDFDLTRSDGRIAPLTLYIEPSPAGFTITAIQRLAAGRVAPGAGGDMRIAPFFQSAPFGIAMIDGKGRIASCNTAFMRMVLDGRPANEAPVLDALCLTAEADERAAVAAGLGEVLAGRGAVAPFEITAGDQKQFTRRIYMSPVASVSPSEAAALYVIDATEQKALENRFAQAQKMEAVGKLAGGIAHDFNNVLTAIIGFSDLLLQTHRPSDAAYKDIKNIQSAANRAAGLVSNLLGFSRKQTQQVSILNLGEVAADMTPILKTAVGEKVDLKIQSERDLWYVRADSNQVFNVILNLVRNARDAMPNGGYLTVKTRNVSERESQKTSAVAGFTPGEYVVIEVTDSGTGMSPEVMAKIFEPFFTTKGVGKGTGLGLASVYGIVKQSGGFILPESEVGVGTTFKVYLPRYALDADDEADVGAASAKPVNAKRDAKAADLTGTGRVLLVEDEVEVRQFAVRALKRQGYHVLEAADGVEALDVMGQNEDVDIVVSDVVMPEMDGPTLFKELRRRNPSIKVIFVSGYPNEAFREQLGEEEFAFLPKPFSLPQLAAKVKEELAK